MRRKKRYIHTLMIASIIMLGHSCSTKKKSWVNRQYHNTTAKYNGYFNGNESIKNGVKKLHKNHIDDYTSIISVFPTGNLKKTKSIGSYMDKAIQKGSIVIQRHSIKIKGKEYCRWIDENYLMVGKGYFYKGEIDEAIKTFSYVKNEYKEDEITYNATLWLIRGYVEKGDFSSAELELEEALEDKKFPEKLKKKLSVVAADLYIQKKDFISAIPHLTEATHLIKKKRKKVRLNYILAQIHQQSKNYLLAQKHYELVLRSNPEYEMAFNAKMNLARSLEAGNSNTKKMKQKLLKMSRDDKNKEYLDQIYYTLAEMEMISKDTNSAVENYILSTVNSIKNNSQKALSFFAVGKIEFEKRRYQLAKTHYDSTIFYMEKDFRLYKEASERHEILKELVLYSNVVEIQDSLQMLAKLPKSEQQQIILGIIKEIQEKERLEEEEKRLKQQMLYETGRNTNGLQQFGSNTSGGKWYFYNPATLSFGMSEFRKKWGKRKLEDDWRRKDKKTTLNFDSDSTAKDSSLVETENKKDPNYYFEKLPKTKEDFDRSNALIKDALYQIGMIYKNQLKEINLSDISFHSIFLRYPSDLQYAPLSLYSIYTNHTDKTHIRAIEAKEGLLKNYPQSVYAKMIVNPQYKEETLKDEDLKELSYQEIFNEYKNKRFDEVLIKTNQIIKDKYQNKLLLLRACSFIEKNNIEKAKIILKKISREDKSVFEEAQYILEAIKDPTKMKKANELAITGSPYLYRTNNKHMVVLVLPKEGVDITYLKTLISDFNLNIVGNEGFEISALLLGLEHHILMIKTFENVKEAMSYYEFFHQEQELMERLKKSEYKLMPISFENFEEFYKNKDVFGYYSFFKKNYLIND